MSNKYIFILGRTNDLCLSELKSVLSVFSTQLTKVSDDVVCVESENPLPIDELNKLLGGIIKIGKVQLETKTIEAAILANILTANQKTGEKITFGLSFYGIIPKDLNKNNLQSQIKRNLQESKFTARFVAGNENTLSSVTIEKQKARDLLIIGLSDGYIVGETLKIQDFEEWNKRDFGRPEVDPKKGMLPLKVARMMLNLGLNWKTEEITILDPFCGTGTILAEAAVLGAKVIGADISAKAIEKTTKNLSWLKEIYNLGVNPKLFVSDATHISSLVEKESVDLIVTEPFMGPLISTVSGTTGFKGKPLRLEDVKNVIKGLDKLYLGCFKEWYKVLKTNGKIVIAIPSLRFEGKDFLANNVIDNREKLGYTLTASAGSYSRPQAVVKRNIYVFEKS